MVVRDAIRHDATTVSSPVEPAMQRALDLASEKGSSAWLTCRPLQAHGHTLTEQEFRHAIRLRCDWIPLRLPSHCQCGQAFAVAHALSCSLGGFPTLQHNGVRNITVPVLKRVSHQIAMEPHIQPLSDEKLRYRTAI